MVSLEAGTLSPRKCSSCGTFFVTSNARQIRCSSSCRPDRIHDWQFVGVDGEGLGSNPSQYALLGVGEKQLFHSDSRNLPWDECLEFLYSEFERRGKGNIFIGFFLGYDFTQIFKTLPEDRARMLYTPAGKSLRKSRKRGMPSHPVSYLDWQFDLLGNRRLRLRPKRCRCLYSTCSCSNKAPWMTICDVGSFWQTSLLKMLDPNNWPEPIVTSEEYELIKKGKERRDIAVLDDEMRFYNRLENDVLVRAMTHLASGFRDIDIKLRPTQWIGPGQAAGNWIEKRIPKSVDYLENVPSWFLRACRDSYFGGWFEITCHGHIPGITYEYDINSAYPAQIERLPCLRHGTYTRGTGSLTESACDGNALTLVRTRANGFNHSPNGILRDIGPRYLGTMLHRNSHGEISRPTMTEGWFWYDELRAAIDAKIVQPLSESEILEWVSYEPCSCDAPLSEIAELYDYRLAQGKKTPVGIACKLAYNAGYGKFAQSVGEPPFGNPVYASKITSGCRTEILKAIATHPRGIESVAMVATDAIFFLTEHPGLTVSSRLGSWDRELREGLTLFKPGVYWDNRTRELIASGKQAQFKSRGVNAAEFGREIGRIDELFANWDTRDPESNNWPTVSFHSSFSMVTALQALQRGKWNLAGSVSSTNPTQSSIPSSKRTGLYYDKSRGIFRSHAKLPYWNDTRNDWECISKPYEKKFGLEDPWSDESVEQLGITDDGSLADAFRGLLRE